MLNSTRRAYPMNGECNRTGGTARDRCRLLIVDDMPAIRLLLREIACAEGFEVTESWNLAHANAQLVAVRPNIVLLDRGLPDGDGLTLLDQIRALDPSINVIVVTASDERHRVQEAIARGVHRYIIKPFKPHHVRAELQRFLRLPV